MKSNLPLPQPVASMIEAGKSPELQSASGFERSLFDNGVLGHEADTVITEAEGQLQDHVDWHKRVKWSPDRAAENIDHHRHSLRHGVTWQETFGDRVPAHWDSWDGVRQDFDKAEELGVELSSGLVDAGVAHDHHLVANTVGKTHRLNERQLAWLFARGDMPAWNTGEILDVQREKGATTKDIEGARKLAQELLDNIRNSRADDYGIQAARIMLGRVTGAK